MQSNNHLFVTTLLSLTLISHTAFGSSRTPKPYSQFIANSCNATTYPSSCIKTLTPYASTVGNDSVKLINTALNVAINTSKVCSNTVSKLSYQKGIPRFDAQAIKDCIGDLKDAVDELKQTMNSMESLNKAGGGGGGGGDREFQWANAKTYASAAITDADTCVDGFLGGNKLDSDVMKKIRSCATSFEQATSNALALINHLY